MLKQLSDALGKMTENGSKDLVHIGGKGIRGRTGLTWKDSMVLTMAQSAETGETVPLLTSEGNTLEAKVKAYDTRTGLALLSVEGLKRPEWKPGPLPKVGTLALVVAYASPGGVEARLDLVRYTGGSTQWAPGVEIDHHFQTDGTPFPGFSGAVVLDPDGLTIGWVVENRHGNEGFMIPIGDLEKLGLELLANGSRKKAYLGVNTRPHGNGNGLSLISLEAGGPAELAHWKKGDLLLSLNGQPLTNPMKLISVLGALTPGQSYGAKILRGEEVLELPVVPGGR